MIQPEIIPAEVAQADEAIAGSHCWLAIPLAFALGILLTIVAGHSL